MSEHNEHSGRGERDKKCACCHEAEVYGDDFCDSGGDVTWPRAAALGLGCLILAGGLLAEHILGDAALAGWRRWLLYGIPYLACGYPVIREAWSSLRAGRFFDEFTLMAGASFAAVCLGEVAEALGVMIFYQIGEMFQERAAGNSRRSIRKLLSAKPVSARVVRGDELVLVPPEEVDAGMKVLVKPGEKIPIDGLVAAGDSRVDTSPITGEAVPVRAVPGTKVFGGTINVDGAITVEASGPFADSSIARVMEMVENAVARKSKTERFISKFAAAYTPAMFGVALLTAAVPPIFAGEPWRGWIYRALVVLMISCPCALVVSIPLGYFGGIGAASRRGILVKGGGVLDAANDISAVAFDKTGTLTQGVFEVSGVYPAPGVGRDELVSGASVAEALSNHPVARSIQQAFGAAPSAGITSREVPGKGVISSKDGIEYAAGNASLMKDCGVWKDGAGGAGSPENSSGGTVVYVARGGCFLGSVTVSDLLKSDAAQAIARLKARGVKSYMLTGDREEGAAWVAKELELDGHRSGLLPDMKVTALAELAGNAKTAFVGDGINDAPLLACSHVGVAMGKLGSEVAIEAADAVVLNDAPSRVADLLDISKRTRSIVRGNIGMALAAKAVFMALGIAGTAGLWEAIFADVGVALLAILNAARVGR